MRKPASVLTAAYLRAVEQRLEDIRRQNRLRDVRAPAPLPTDFASNDYLGLGTEPRVVATLAAATRAGSGGARLLRKHLPEYARLETGLARYVCRERALVFSSGYLAIAGAVAVLSSFVRAIYSDERNHASIIDAVRATGLPRNVYPHDAPPPRAQRVSPALIVSESVFSMGGERANLAALVADLADEDVLVVDEAHALGVLGPSGAGLAAPFADLRIVVVGTLSKALGALGGFVAGPAPLIELLVNAARPFIFDTALPPAIVAAAGVALELAASEEWRRDALRGNVARLRAGIAALGLSEPVGEAPIVPVILGTEARALSVARALEERGIAAPAIRPPTVPPGSSRLRLSIRADHRPNEIDAVLEALRSAIW